MVDKIVQKFKAISANPKLKSKLLFTAGVFFVFRLLAQIPLPAVDINQLQSIFAESQFLSLLNIFSGGTLSRFSVVAVGINPYITSSIIMQLGGMVFPQLKEMQKEGESGKAKLNQYTRLLAVPLAVVQSISILALLNSQSLLTSFDPISLAVMVLTLVAGAMIMLWLGELITIHGIGNGISMILFAGITSQLPVALSQTLSIVTAQQYTILLSFLGLFLLVVALIVFINEAIRKVKIQYAKRTRGSRVLGGHSTHLPIRVNVAGVLPIIFAVSLMLAPPFISRILISSSKDSLINLGQKMAVWFVQTSPVYMTLYFLLVFGFTFFSALIFFNAGDISEELKKSGAFVPGVRPGGATKKFLEFVVTRITLVGALFLGLISILPSLAQILTGIQSLAIGGTSVLIVVSVILETTKQVESMLVGQNYEKYG